MKMQNDMPMMTQTWKSKPKIEFQHGGRLFPKIGSSNISAMDKELSAKFGMQIDFDLPNCAK